MNKQLLDWLHRHKPESSADWPIYHDTVLKFISVEEEHLGIEEQTVLEPLRKVRWLWME